jgi:hypothetical protein
MTVDVQTVIVTLAALGAGAVFVRRFFGGRNADAPSCPSCDSGASCAPAKDSPREPEVKPLVLIKKPKP